MYSVCVANCELKYGVWTGLAGSILHRAVAQSRLVRAVCARQAYTGGAYHLGQLAGPGILGVFLMQAEWQGWLWSWLFPFRPPTYHGKLLGAALASPTMFEKSSRMFLNLV